MSMDAANLKSIACDAIDAAADDLYNVSLKIWENPELGYEEEKAHGFLTQFLDGKGFSVEKQFVIPTGFRAIEGSDSQGPHVSVLCEYDALPEIGHACGHNLIAEVGVGAGIGIKAALDAAKASGKSLGKLTVLGTPNEEAEGGKQDMIKAGVMDDMDVSMMAHPCAFNSGDMGSMLIAQTEVLVTYHGKASHAAGFPWDGVNALDAAVIAYQSISNLRQQMKPKWSVQGIIKKGGAKPNIIPEETVLEYYVRAPTMKELTVFKDKVSACFSAAATATGCSVEMAWSPRPFMNMITNRPLVELYNSNAKELGIVFSDKPGLLDSTNGSTDMGNVSHVVPSIHPMYYIGTEEENHTRGFQTASGEKIAQAYTLNQAKALAMTAIDVYCNPALVDTMKQALERDLEKVG